MGINKTYYVDLTTGKARCAGASYGRHFIRRTEAGEFFVAAMDEFDAVAIAQAYQRGERLPPEPK